MSLKTSFRQNVLDPIRRAQGTPESIARGGAMGMWLALTPTVGVQMAAASVLAIPLRANLPVALAMVWISNPVTVIPLYVLFYWLGTLVLGEEAADYDSVRDTIRAQYDLIREQGLIESLPELGGELLWPMVVGSVIVATVVAIPTYHVLLWAFRRRAARHLLEQVEHMEQTQPAVVQEAPPLEPLEQTEE